MKKMIWVGFILFFFSLNLSGQEKLDAPDYEKLLQTLETEAQQAYFEAHYQTALRKWKQCITIYKQLGDSINIAKTQIRVGTIFAQVGEYARAFAEMKAAENLFSALNEEYELIQTYKTTARLHFNLANYNQMRELYQKGLFLAEKLKSVGEKVQMLVGIGQTYYLYNDFDQARIYYKRAFKLVSSGEPNWWQARILTYFGILAFYDSQIDSALSYFENAIEIQKLINDENGLKDNYLNIGIINLNKNELNVASAAFSKSLTLQQKLNDIAGEIQTEIKLGDVAYQQFAFQRAERLYNSALEKSIERGDRELIAESRKKIGFIHFSQDFPDKAENQLQEALSIAHSINDPRLIWRIVHGLGLVSEKQKLFTQAFQYYFQALSYIELTKYQQIYATPGTEFTRNETDVYNSAIESAQKLSQRTGAREWKERIFEISERKIARQLNHKLEAVAVKTCSVRINRKIQLYRSYSLQHSAINKLLANEKRKELLEQNIPKVISLKKHIKSIEARRFQLQTEVISAFPRFRDLFAIHHPTLQQFQNALRPEQILLKYILLKERLLILVIQQNQVEIVEKIYDQAGFLADIKNIKNFLKSTSQSESEATLSFKKTNQRMSQLLLEPIQEKMSQAKELIILPDIPLQLFPFEGLLWKSRDNSATYLIEKIPIFYISRANVAFIKANHRSPIPKVLNFISAQHQNSESSKNLINQDWAGLNRIQLPDSANFCQAKKINPGVSHFDFPGFWDGKSPRKSIFETSFNAKNRWHLANWFKVRFSPETLLCLPDLNISPAKSERPSLLPEIFYLMGVRCTFFSQQRLAQKEQKNFLANFYENLNDGNSPAKSLQLAKIKWLNSSDYASPGFWTNYFLFY